jgi:hypothetical protein
LVILDASSDVITANWSTEFWPRRFLGVLDGVGDFTKAEVIADMSKPELVHMNLGHFKNYMWSEPEVFDQKCRFLRLDLSATRSIFWQVLDFNLDEDDYGDDVVRFAGIGDATSQFAENDDGLAQYLLTETAAPELSIRDILGDISELTGMYYNGYSN